MALKIIMDRPTAPAGHLCDGCTYRRRISGPGWENQHCQVTQKSIPGMVSECSAFANRHTEWGAPREIRNSAWYLYNFMGQKFWIRYEDETVADGLDLDEKLEFLKKVTL